MKTIEESRARMINQTADPSRPWVEDYAIFLKPSTPGAKPAHVGMVGAIREIQNAEHLGVNGAPEFGYMVNIQNQGKGLGTEAVKGFLDMYWGLERRKGVQALVAIVDETNSGSVHVMEKVGGVLLGKDDHGDVWVVRRPAEK